MAFLILPCFLVQRFFAFFLNLSFLLRTNSKCICNTWTKWLAALDCIVVIAVNFWKKWNTNTTPPPFFRSQLHLNKTLKQLHEDGNVTAEELISFTNGSSRVLTQFQKLEICFFFLPHFLGKFMEEEKLRSGIRFVAKIPRNDLGKIVRPELVQLLKFKRF
jgi:hypothetical protein